MPGPVLPRDLVEVILSLDGDGIERLLCDLLAPSEVAALGERWQIVKLLAAGQSQRSVRDRLGVGVATVSRGSRQLQYGHNGFALAFSALKQLGHEDPRDHYENPRITGRRRRS